MTKDTELQSSTDNLIPAAIPFPKGAICLLIAKVFERFSFNGTRAVLVMYLTISLAYSSDDATLIYHVFNVVIFLMSIVGAIISDSWLGKYRTILYMSSAYAAGLIVLNVSSLPMLVLPGRELTLVALLLIAVGSGTLKPCMTAFGGDQFQLPQQERQLALYYTLYYMMLKLAQLFGYGLAPVLRNDVQCFGNENCFPLAFGVPSLFVVAALGVLLLGNIWFVKRPKNGNVLIEFGKCIWHAARMRYANGRTDPKAHWLDHAESRFGQQLVIDVKCVLNMLCIYMWCPMFYALSDQVGSRWTFQAAALNGDLGFYQVKPDQMQFLMPLLILLMLAVWDWMIQPIINWTGGMLVQWKFIIGGVLAAISFLIAGGLQMMIQPSTATMAATGECQVRVFNGDRCDFRLQIDETWMGNVGAFDRWQGSIPIGSVNTFAAELVSNSSDCANISFSMHLTGGSAVSFFIRDNELTEYVDNPSKDLAGKATLRVLVAAATNETLRIVRADALSDTGAILYDSQNLRPLSLSPATYQISMEHGMQTVSPVYVTLEYAGVYTLLLDPVQHKLFEISPPSTLSVLWILPQFAVMAMAEALFTTTGFYFAYRESPSSMKTVAQSMLLLAISAGNLITVIVVSASLFDTIVGDFFLFAGLMFANCVVMSWFMYRFKSLKVQ